MSCNIRIERRQNNFRKLECHKRQNNEALRIQKVLFSRCKKTFFTATNPSQCNTIIILRFCSVKMKEEEEESYHKYNNVKYICQII